MGSQTVKFDATLGEPQVEVIIGQAQFGTYRIYLWDSSGKNPKTIGEGTSNDDVADIFSLGPLSDLNGKILTWEVLVSSATSDPGQLYAVTVVFRQNGTALPGGVFSQSGALQGTQAIHGQVTFEI